MKKFIALLVACLILCALVGCSGKPNYTLMYYDMIQYNGTNYSRLEPLGEAQPATDFGDTIDVYLIGYNGEVDKEKAYKATLYADDPEEVFIYFDSIDWVKEGYHDEWTVPHIP